MRTPRPPYLDSRVQQLSTSIAGETQMHRRCYPTQGLLYDPRCRRDGSGAANGNGDTRSVSHRSAGLHPASCARPTTSSASRIAASKLPRLSRALRSRASRARARSRDAMPGGSTANAPSERRRPDPPGVRAGSEPRRDRHDAHHRPRSDRARRPPLVAVDRPGNSRTSDEGIGTVAGGIWPVSSGVKGVVRKN